VKQIVREKDFDQIEQIFQLYTVMHEEKQLVGDIEV
jgi:hypothetical protein